MSEPAIELLPMVKGLLLYLCLADAFFDRCARLRLAEGKDDLIVRIACLLHEKLPVYFTRSLTFSAVLFSERRSSTDIGGKLPITKVICFP